MKIKLELVQFRARTLKSTLQRCVYVVLTLLGGVQLSQSVTASPLSTENRAAFEQNLIEAAYDFEEQRKREENEAKKTVLIYDQNKKLK